MDMSAAASMSYGVFSGNISVDALRKVSSSAYSNYIIGRVTVTTEPTILKTTGLSDLGKKASDAGIDFFHRSCGTEYAGSAVYGGEFIFMLEIISKDDAEFQNVRADLSAHVGNLGSASAQFSQSIEQISHKYQLTASQVRNGLNEKLPEDTPAAYAEYTRDFPEKVTANDGIGMRVLRIRSS